MVDIQIDKEKFKKMAEKQNNKATEVMNDLSSSAKRIIESLESSSKTESNLIEDQNKDTACIEMLLRFKVCEKADNGHLYLTDHGKQVAEHVKSEGVAGLFISTHK